METANKKLQAMKGGGSLTIESLPSETFIPEDFTEEQKMMMDMCHQFLETEINPLLDRIDKLEPGLMPSLMEKAGEMGLLGVSIPESYGGLGKDFMSAIISSTTAAASDLLVPITPDGPRLAQPTTYTFSFTRPSVLTTFPFSYGTPSIPAA